MKVCVTCDELKRALECVSLAAGGSSGKGKKKEEDTTDAGGISITAQPVGKGLCFLIFRKRGAFEVIEYTIAGKCGNDENITCVVDGKRFIALAKLFDGSVELSFSPKEVLFVADSSRYRLLTLLDNEVSMPVFPATQITISPDILQDINRRCEFTCSKDLNHIQSAMQLNLCEDGSAVCYGSQKVMASQYVVPSTGVKENKSILILPASMVHICELSDSQDINLAIDNKGLYAVTERYKYYAKPLAGKYPDCAKIMGQPLEHTLRVSKPRLLEAISRATVVAADDAYSRLCLYTDGNDLLLEAVSEVGSASETLALESIDSPMEKRAISGTRLRSIVYAVSGDDVVIRYSTPMKPLLLSSTAGECLYMLAAMALR